MELLTVSNAAQRLGRSESTIRRWADSGRLKLAVRLADGSRLFHENDVAAVIARQGGNALLEVSGRCDPEATRPAPSSE